MTTKNNTRIRTIFVPLDSLVVTDNVRLPNLYQVEPLADDIESNGLDTPIMVWQPKGKDSSEFEVLRGHRRRRALIMVRERSPERFEALFSKGVPVELRVGIDANEALRLKVDHGNVQALTHEHEIQMAASMLFDSGATEGEVAVTLRGLFEATKPMRGKNLERIKGFLAKMEGATPTQAAKLQEEINKCVRNFHRGRVQGLRKIWRLPKIVSDARFFHACGERPEGVQPTEYLPKVTTGAASTLVRALEKDLKVTDENGISKYSKRNPGPAFYKAWDELCTEDQKPTVDTPRSKAMSGAAIRESGGRYSSIGFRAVCSLHCGDNPDIAPAVKEADELLYTAELISKHEPELWESLLETRKTVEQRLVAEARAEAEAKANAEAVEA